MRSPAEQSPFPPGAEKEALSFDAIYERHFSFVWRNVRRMGLPDGAIDDAVQDVFLVVHRRLGDFEGRSSISTWLFGIILRVVKDHRRALSRRSAFTAKAEALAPAVESGGPEDDLERREAMRLLHALLDELDEDKRALLVMTELEQIPINEAAEILGMKANTAYSRLRTARQGFEAALERHRRRESGGRVG